MGTRGIPRRQLFIQGSSARAELALVSSPWLAQAFSSRPDEQVIRRSDQPPSNPRPDVVRNLRQ